MAIDSYIKCEVCKQDKRVTHSLSAMTPSICHQCEELQRDVKRINHLAECAMLTIEERLAKIE